MYIINKLIDPKSILKEEQIKGELPTTKEILKKTFNIAWPSALESLLVAMIATMDMIMVGSLGKEALSAVGICTQPKNICLAPIIAINTATVVFVSRKKGENNRKEAIDYAKIAIILSLIVSLFVCLLSYIYSKQILLFAGANSDYIDLATSYYRIVTISLIPYSVGLTMTSAHRGAGFTKISLITNLTANIVNIIFNLFLINGYWFFPRLGVVGAAIATAIGNVASFIIACFAMFNHKSFININFNKIESLFIKTKDLITIALNAFAEQIILRIGFFIYAKVVANLGTSEFAAHQATMSIMNITFSIGEGLQIANTSLVGQSIGAKREDMAIVHTRTTVFIGMCVGMFVFFILSAFKRSIVGVFTTDPEVIELAMIPITILSIVCIFQIQQVIMFGTLRGAKDLKIVTRIQFVCVGIIRPFFSYFLVYPMGLGLLGAWLGLLTDQLTRFTCSLIRIRSNKWIKINNKL